MGVFPSAGARLDGLSRRLIAYLGLLALALGRPNHLSRYLLVPMCRRCAGASDENTNVEGWTASFYHSTPLATQSANTNCFYTAVNIAHYRTREFLPEVGA